MKPEGEELANLLMPQSLEEDEVANLLMLRKESRKILNVLERYKIKNKTKSKNKSDNGQNLLFRSRIRW